MKHPVAVDYLPLSLIYLFGIGYLAYLPDQHEFGRIIAPYAVSFVVYWIFLKKSFSYPFRHLIALAIVARVVCLFSFPNLSDDIFRFIWDGRLLHAGINPFSVLPEEIVNAENSLTVELYADLNSPVYYSVYPPFAQVIFYLSTAFVTESLFLENVLMKLLLLAGEMGVFYSIYLLLQLEKKDGKLLLIYALNPLVIIEVMGNLHFEGLLVCFFIGSLVFWKKGHVGWSAVLFALSVGTKLFTLMFLPALLLTMKPADRKKFCLITFSVLGLLFIPFLISFDLAGHWGDSLDLYMRTFEFNASIYYLLRWAGYLIYGYNLIHILGPLLAITTTGLIVWLAWKKSQQEDFTRFITICMISFTLYLFLSTTIHPWYLIVPLALCIWTPYRYLVAWSGMVIISYAHYHGEVNYERMLLLAIEYGVVFIWFISEMRKYPFFDALKKANS